MEGTDLITTTLIIATNLIAMITIVDLRPRHATGIPITTTIAIVTATPGGVACGRQIVDGAVSSTGRGKFFGFPVDF